LKTIGQAGNIGKILISLGDDRVLVVAIEQAFFWPWIKTNPAEDESVVERLSRRSRNYARLPRHRFSLSVMASSCIAVTILGLMPALAGDDGRTQQGLPHRESALSGTMRRRLRDTVIAADDWTFRPTVLVRKGSSQGSGTVIASLDGETLVLTANHVVRAKGPVLVELHRYNLGLERKEATPGVWPKLVIAEVAATDVAGDVAVLRVRNMKALPYVARLAEGDQEPESDTMLTSVGIDLGTNLTSWKTPLVEVLRFQLNDSGAEKPFLITARIPQHGRSGGGLFSRKGELVGLCIGHAELVKSQRMGVFASIESIRRVLQDNELSAVVNRSEARIARMTHVTKPGAMGSTRVPRSITQTESHTSAPRLP
jgi:S1-C subfamily serine protease